MYNIGTLSLVSKLFVLCRYVFARPSGKRCFVVSSQGATVSILRNGTILHRFPSALPGGARKTSTYKAGSCILDCIFHEVPHLYYSSLMYSLLSWYF